MYYNQSNAHNAINQGCYKLSTFWSQLDVCLPRWRTDKDLEGFKGFCHNLQNERPDTEVMLDNSQQFLTQYVFPGIGPANGVVRMAYPAAKYAKLQHLQKRLARDVMRSGQWELEILLEAKPLVSDDDWDRRKRRRHF